MYSFCKLLHFICCILFFTLNAFAQSVCEQGFSVVENGDLIKSDRVRNDLVRNAEIKLEQDLQAIRNSPQEPLLKAQGFKPSYYLGVDQAREFNRVREYLQAIKANPEHTHIFYFADQVEKTISDFEKSFRKYNQDSPEFLEERLKILEELKKEARKRMKDQNVTYDWWANFNLRLSMIASDFDFQRRGLRADNVMDNLKNHQSAKALLPFLGFTEKFTQWYGLKEETFPEYIMFFTTDELGIMAFNKLEDQSGFIGVSGKPLIVDGDKLEPFNFFSHDRVHIDESIIIDEKILKRIDSISKKSDREKAELALFIYRHEVGFDAFSSYLRNYYTGSANLFRPKMREITADIKKSSQEMMKGDNTISRFLDPDDLQGMLSDSVNVNHREEVVKFLADSADIFADVVLAL